MGHVDSIVRVRWHDVPMAASLLDRAIYSYADVDRLIGLPAGTARRWLNGYERNHTFYEPVLRPEPDDRDVVTWGELVESRLLAEFRTQRVPIQRMRPAIVRLRREFGPYPLAQARPFLEASGRELVRRVQQEVSLDAPLQLVVVRNDQLILSTASERFNDSVQFASGVVESLAPLHSTPMIRLDPQRAFGQPIITGRSVRTSALVENFRAGTSVHELAELYELDTNEIEEALRFELSTVDHEAA